MLSTVIIIVVTLTVITDLLPITTTIVTVIINASVVMAFTIWHDCGFICTVMMLQGTLYPDVIESCPPPGSGQKHSHTIKSHHNVGGLPKDLDFTLIEPLRELFKVSFLFQRSSDILPQLSKISAAPLGNLCASAPCILQILTGLAGFYCVPFST